MVLARAWWGGNVRLIVGLRSPRRILCLLRRVTGGRSTAPPYHRVLVCGAVVMRYRISGGKAPSTEMAAEKSGRMTCHSAEVLIYFHYGGLAAAFVSGEGNRSACVSSVTREAHASTFGSERRFSFTSRAPPGPQASLVSASSRRGGQQGSAGHPFIPPPPSPPALPEPSCLGLCAPGNLRIFSVILFHG